MAAVRQELIREFMQICGSTMDEARTYLETSQYSMTIAVDKYLRDATYYENSTTKLTKRPKTTSNRTLSPVVDEFYHIYKSADDSEVIDPDGIQRLSDDLGIDPLDVVWLVIAEKCQAKTMGYFRKDEWSRGMQSLNCLNLDQLKRAIQGIRSSLSSDPTVYKAVYAFSFRFTLEEGARNISAGSALALWSLLLPHCGWRLTDEFLEFVRSQEEQGKCKAITKDVWNMIPLFANRFSDHSAFREHDDGEDAWPLILDEFSARMKPIDLTDS